MKKEAKKLFWAISILALFALLLKLLFIWKNSTAFTYDQARDLLDLREMWLLKKPRLIGANTSLHGVFYGPFWYWLCFPFYLLTGGHPATGLIPILLISFLLPLIVFFLLSDKRLAFLLGVLYIFSHSFFSRSIVALNTNPMIFFAVLFLVLLAKFHQSQKQIFLSLTMFLTGASFHFEPLIGILWIPIFLITGFLFKKTNLILKNKKAVVFLLIPFVPQLFFELRHNFLQTKAFLTLLTGGSSSLTPAEGGVSFRFFDRLLVFRDIFVLQSGDNKVLAVFLAALIAFLIFKLLKTKPPKKENDYLGQVCLISLVLIFIGFVFYPYALWPWYLDTVDGIMITLIGAGFYFLFKQGKNLSVLAFIILLGFLYLNISKYFPWPLERSFSENEANLRTRIKVVDLIYDDVKGQGFKVFTFAPYVYDYPYQYLIWWRAKTKYQYLPEEYTYLSDQPPYVPAKEVSDLLVEKRASSCEYLIIEPYYSQKSWYEDWRGRFPDASKTWEVGETRVEKLCEEAP